MTANNIGSALTLAAIVGIIGSKLWLNYRMDRRRESSWNWPTTEAAIDAGWVGQTSAGDTTRPCLSLSFRYYVSGEPYAGLHEENVSSEMDGLFKLERMKGRPIFVRYNPKSPKEYFVDATCP
jgi:hypothetical protein